MSSQQRFTEMEAAVEQFLTTIGGLANEVNRQKESLIALRAENEDFEQQLGEMREENVNLRRELDAKSEQIEAQTEAIAGYQTSINDITQDRNRLVEENQKLFQNINILRQQVSSLNPLVDQLQQKNENLSLDKGKMDTELVKKNDEIKRMQIVAQQSADAIRMKDNSIEEWKLKAGQYHSANQQLNQEVSKLQMKLLEAEMKHTQASDQLAALKLTHDVKMKEWYSKYQQLEKEYQRQDIELNAFKEHNMVTELFDLHKLLHDLKVRIESARQVTSAHVNSDRRTAMQERIRGFYADYRRMASNLESHNVNYPRFDLASLDKCVRLHQGLNETLKNRLDRIHTIDKETQAVWDALKLIAYKIIDTQKTLIGKYLAELDGIETTPVTQELAEVESLYEEAESLRERMTELAARSGESTPE